VERGILNTRNATLLALAVFLAVAVAAIANSPVYAQYAPCQGYGGSCYPGYGNGYSYQYGQYGYCGSGYYYPSYNNCYNRNYGYSNYPYGYCQSGYYYGGSYCNYYSGYPYYRTRR